jgi:hypothetical protein
MINMENDITNKNIIVKDPSAFPTGTADMDERITRAIDENRWLKVGEYAEEWQRVVLLSINGLSGLARLSRTCIKPDSTGAVKTLGGELAKTDDATVFIDALDKQITRMNAVIGYLDGHDLELDGKPIRKGFKDDMGLVTMRLNDIISNPGSPSVSKDLIDARDGMLSAMEMAGFGFEMKKMPLVGEKYVFKMEPLFVGRKTEPA